MSQANLNPNLWRGLSLTIYQIEDLVVIHKYRLAEHWPECSTQTNAWGFSGTRRVDIYIEDMGIKEYISLVS